MVKESKYFDEIKVGVIFIVKMTIWLRTVEDWRRSALSECFLVIVFIGVPFFSFQRQGLFFIVFDQYNCFYLHTFFSLREPISCSLFFSLCFVKFSAALLYIAFALNVYRKV